MFPEITSAPDQSMAYESDRATLSSGTGGGASPLAVSIGSGSLMGLHGQLVSHRPGARALVQLDCLAPGILLEIEANCLCNDGSP